MPEMPGPDGALRAALHGVRGLLLDLDGVLVLAGKAIAGAPAAMDDLDRRALPYLLVTNTSLVSRPSLAAWGRSVGFSTPPDRLQSALSASAELVRREYGRRPVFVIASADALAEFEGLNVVDAAGAKAAADGEVAAVVLGDSPDQLTKANLDVAFRLVRGGAELIGMHRNPWWITPEGPTLDAGAFLVALEWATGRRARTVGKPAPAFFRRGDRPPGGGGRGARGAAAPALRARDGRRRRRVGHPRRPAGGPADDLRAVRQARRRGAR